MESWRTELQVGGWGGGGEETGEKAGLDGTVTVRVLDQGQGLG